MKNLLISLTCLCAMNISAQEVLDTVYYDANWKGCSKTFSTYYRVMTRPSTSNPTKQFRDFYMTGQVRGEGYYISIDKNNDQNSIFDGQVLSYYKSGEVMELRLWKNSHLEGDYVTFYENGNVKTHCVYNSEGQLDGNLSYFDENGNLLEVQEYSNGMSMPYFSVYNQFGTQGRYDMKSKRLVQEPVSISDMKVKIMRQKKYYYYDDKNGIYMSLSLDAVKNYGKYYGIGLTLFNNTNTSFIFYPEQIRAYGRFSTEKNSKDKKEKKEVKDNKRKIKKIVDGQSNNNWAENAFGSLFPSQNEVIQGLLVGIEDGILVEENTTNTNAISIDRKMISSTAYRYRLNLANLNFKKDKSKENDSTIDNQWGLVFNYVNDGNYCALILSFDDSITAKGSDPKAMNLVLVQCINNNLTELARTAVTKDVSLNGDMNIICIDVNENDVYVSIGKYLSNHVLEASVMRPEGSVQVGLFVGPKSRVGVEWAILTDRYIEYEKQPKPKETTNYSYNDSQNNLLSSEPYGGLPSSMESKAIKVWSYNDYIKRVEKRQFFDKTLMAVAATVSTLDAGTSTTNTTITTHGSAQGHGNGNASVHSTYGSAYGTYNNNAYASGNATTRINTKTYDALAAAIAQERAATEFAVYASSLEADTESINENYLMTTTLDPQTQITGYILLDKDKPNIIDLCIPVNGSEYLFRISDVPK